MSSATVANARRVARKDLQVATKKAIITRGKGRRKAPPPVPDIKRSPPLTSSEILHLRIPKTEDHLLHVLPHIGRILRSKSTKEFVHITVYLPPYYKSRVAPFIVDVPPPFPKTVSTLSSQKLPRTSRQSPPPPPPPVQGAPPTFQQIISKPPPPPPQQPLFQKVQIDKNRLSELQLENAALKKETQRCARQLAERENAVKEAVQRTRKQIQAEHLRKINRVMLDMQADKTKTTVAETAAQLLRKKKAFEARKDAVEVALEKAEEAKREAERQAARKANRAMLQAELVKQKKSLDDIAKELQQRRRRAAQEKK